MTVATSTGDFCLQIRPQQKRSFWRRSLSFRRRLTSSSRLSLMSSSVISRALHPFTTNLQMRLLRAVVVCLRDEYYHPGDGIFLTTVRSSVVHFYAWHFHIFIYLLQTMNSKFEVFFSYLGINYLIMFYHCDSIVI